MDEDAQWIASEEIETGELPPLRPSLKGRGRHILAGAPLDEDVVDDQETTPYPSMRAIKHRITESSPEERPAQQPRPSLHGRGYRIFTGEAHPPAEAVDMPVSLPPAEEPELSHSVVEENEIYTLAPEVEALAPAEPEIMDDPFETLAGDIEAAAQPSSPEVDEMFEELPDAEAVPPIEDTLGDVRVSMPPAPVLPEAAPVAEPAGDYVPAPGVAALTPERPESFVPPDAEAVPPTEDTLGDVRVSMPPVYEPSPAVDAIGPAQPEVFAPTPGEVEAHPPAEETHAYAFVALPTYDPAAEVAALTPAHPERFAVVEEHESMPQAEPVGFVAAVPLEPVIPDPLLQPKINFPAPPAEPYHAPPAVAAVAPDQPETLAAEAIPPAEDEVLSSASLPPAKPPAAPAVLPSTIEESYEIDPAVIACTPDEPERFAPEVQPPPEPEVLPEPDFFDIFDEEDEEEDDEEPAPEPEPETNEIRALLIQIEAIQEDLIQSVTGTQDDIEIHQQALHYATRLLREQTTGAYDEARAVVYRVRAARQRENQIREWSRRYSGRLLVYLSLITMIVVILGMLEPAVRDAAGRLGMAPVVTGLYMPMLFGALGAVFGAFWVLIEQLYIKHDFDPSYVAWFFLTPLIGLISGILTYAIAASIAGLLGGIAVIEEASYFVWALCFVVGAAALAIWGRPRRKAEEDETGDENELSGPSV